MEYLVAYCWPNYPNRAELAKRFFDKAKAGIENLELESNCAFCLFSTTGTYWGEPYTHEMVLVLVESDTSVDDTETVYQKLAAYFERCGCPKEQLIDPVSLGAGKTTVENLVERMGKSREGEKFTIIEDPVIKKVGMPAFTTSAKKTR
jgi:hypothetical protein